MLQHLPSPLRILPNILPLRAMPPQRSPKQPHILRPYQLTSITSSNRRFHPYNPALELRNRSRRARMLPRGPMMVAAGPAHDDDVDMMEADGMELRAMPPLPRLPQILIEGGDERQRWVLVILYALDRLYDLNR
ncbi:hypothetical protein AB1N83_007368 [Pleurotus pulmonarius]